MVIMGNFKYLRGENNVSHGIGEELYSSLVQLVDNDRETENLG